MENIVGFDWSPVTYSQAEKSQIFAQYKEKSYSCNFFVDEESHIEDL